MDLHKEATASCTAAADIHLSHPGSLEDVCVYLCIGGEGREEEKKTVTVAHAHLSIEKRWKIQMMGDSCEARKRKKVTRQQRGRTGSEQEGVQEKKCLMTRT